MDQLRAALADRYTIEQELGRGGMAVVYAALDKRHGRRVALKVLSREESASRNADRFLQEIRITAGLVHPHILPIFDSGEAAGHLYYLMPLVEGESLRTRLQREGRLPIDDAIRLTREIAEGLDCAHRAGVTHRDVKPENILLAHGHAVLADFGIARQATTAPAGGLTAAGTFVGTPEYMSPEVLLGESQPGPWSDLYALGCVTFEMLTGRAPHHGRSSQAMLAARLTGPVPRARELRPDLSPSLEAELVRVLAPEPNDRHGSASEFARALGRGVPGTGAAEISLIVRPFDSVGGDSEVDFFADGLTEEAIGDLSKVRSLRVISRTSAMRLKGTEKDVRTIGREYGVRYVVSGSVRRSGPRVRVATEVVDAVLDTPVWSDRFDGSFDDPFGVQEQVAKGIVGALQLRLNDEERRQLHTRPIADPRAYNYYRRIVAEIVGFTESGLQRAEAMADEALAIVGGSATLHAAKGVVHWQYINAGFDTSAARLKAAQDEIAEALSIDPNCVDALVTRCWIEGGTGRMHDGLLTALRAVTIDPTHTLALSLLGVVCWTQGRHDFVRPWVESLRRLDPFDLYALIIEGARMANDGDRAGRDRAFATADAISPTSIGRLVAGFTCAQDGDTDAAYDWWLRCTQLNEPSPFSDLSGFCVAARDGDTGPLKAMRTNPQYGSLFVNDAQFAWHLAEALAMHGVTDDAIEVLGDAVRCGFCNLPMLEGRDATLRSLHGDPRYQALLVDARRHSADLDRAIREAGF